MLSVIEPIPGLLYLEINILKLFLFTFWKKSNDKNFLLHFTISMKWKIQKDVKDFNLNNIFFYTIIDFYVIAFYIYESDCPEFYLFHY